MYIQSFYPLMLGGSRQHLYCWAMSTGFLPAKGQGTSSKFYHSSFCCFCCSVTKSDSLQFHGLQHVRLPCPSLSPGVCSNSCPLSVMPSTHLILCHSLSLLPSVFPSIRVFSNESAFLFRWPTYWSSPLASVLPMSIQDWFPLGLTDLISLLSRGLSRVFSNTTIQNINSSALNLLYGPILTSINDCWM